VIIKIQFIQTLCRAVTKKETECSTGEIINKNSFRTSSTVDSLKTAKRFTVDVDIAGVKKETKDMASDS